MPLDSVNNLLAVLRRTQLLAPEQVDEVARELVPHYADPEALGEYLVSVDWLTTYQLQMLLAEQWDELTVGPYQVRVLAPALRLGLHLTDATPDHRPGILRGDPRIDVPGQVA